MKKIFNLASIFVAILCVLLLITGVFAWFTGIYREDFTIDGKVNGAYFAGGTGEENNPYIIKNKKHLRNLALLQNNGKFKDDSKKYYFKISDDIETLDMSGIWIPPIGNTDNPFTSDFDGNGKVISGLRVTTNENLSGSKITSSQFSDVGFFGSVEGDASIYEFNLTDIYVDHNVNAIYSGIIAGEAPKDAIQYVGVHTARLGYQKNITAHSSYALIGNTEAHSIIVDDPGGNDPGGDDPDGGDTGHFIPDVIRTKINPSIGVTESIDFGEAEMYLSNNDTNTKNTDNYWGLGCFSFVTETQKSSIRSIVSNNKEIDTTKFRMAVDSDGDGNYTIEDPSTIVDFSGATTYSQGSIEQKHINYIKNLDGTQKNNIEYGLYLSKSPAASTITVYNEAAPTTSIGTTTNIKTSNIKVNIVKPNSKIFIVASQNNSSSRVIGITKVADAQTNFFFKEKYNQLDDSNYNKNNFDYSVSLAASMHKTHIAAIVNISEVGIYNISSTSGGISFNYLAVEGVENGDTGGGTDNPQTTVYYIDKVDFVSSATDFIDDDYEYSHVLFVIELTSQNTEIIVYFKKEDDEVYYGKSNNNISVDDVNSTSPGTSFADFSDFPSVSTST